MARRATHVPRSGATGARVARARSGSANEPTRRQLDARAELLRHAELLLDDRTTGPSADRRAVRYLESSRGLGPPPAPLSPADQHKLAGEQADMMVDVLWAVLDGLGLTQEQHDRGLDFAIKALEEAAGPGWQPL